MIKFTYSRKELADIARAFAGGLFMCGVFVGYGVMFVAVAAVGCLVNQFQESR